MRKKSSRCQAAAIAALLVVGPTAARAQAPPGPGHQHPEVARLRADQTCASPDEEDRFVAALALRVPGVQVVRDAEPGNADWSLDWRRSDGGCVLRFTGEDRQFAMNLGPHPGQSDIDLAASRVAWLASVDDPAARANEAARDAARSTTFAARDDAIEAARNAAAALSAQKAAEAQAARTAKNSAADVEKTAPPVRQPSYTPVGLQVSVVPHFRLAPLPVPPKLVPSASFNIVGGTSYGLDGVEIGGIWNHETSFANGAQFAFGANLVDGDSRAVQVALGLNRVRGHKSGVQLGSLVNLAGSSSGLQFAALYNGARGLSRGVQVAAVNTAGAVHGVQSGVGNFSGQVKGVQLGLVNVGRDVYGAQLGLLNVARTSDFSFGLINVMWGMPVHAVVWTDTGGGVTAGIQHGSQHLRWTYVVGAQPFMSKPSWRAGFGLDGHLALRHFFVDVDDLLFVVVPVGAPFNHTSPMNQFRTLAGWQLDPRLALFGGLAFNMMATGLVDGASLAPKYATALNRGLQAPTPTVPTIFLAWPELQLGVRF